MIQSLALNMVVYNEAHRIKDTLAAALPLVDEAVIVDQSSTDETPDLCREAGARVLTDVHHGFCEASRQMAMDNTSSDWILLLDADEHCAPEFITDMRSLDRYAQVRLRIGLKIAGETFVVGRSVFRLFKRRDFYHDPKIHTCPLPYQHLTPSTGSYLLPYVAIWDTKTWVELLEGMAQYEAIGRTEGCEFLFLARERNVTGAQLDAMTQQGRHALGFHPKQDDLDIMKKWGLAA